MSMDIYQYLAFVIIETHEFRECFCWPVKEPTCELW